MLIKSDVFPSEYPSDRLQDEIDHTKYRPNVFGVFYQAELPVNSLKPVTGEGCYEDPKGIRIGVLCDITIANERQTKVTYEIVNDSKSRELKERFKKAWEDFVDKGGSFGKKEPPKQEYTYPSKIGEDEKYEDIAPKIDALKKEYEALEDKRSARGLEIRNKLKFLQEK